MLLLLLKSSACLTAFMLFYKLCLEKTSAHTFKRFYLIGILIISIGIPFITFTKYVILEPLNFASNLEPENYSNIEFTETVQPKNYLSTVLWSMYFFGMSIFLIRFLKNLNSLFQKIKRNPKFKNDNIFHVLVQELVTPHTFLNYIFLNRTQYENNQIPSEVLLHEQTHAKQKHALDIIFIELLQILFWFNPLLYFIKKDIKLNHEFLADQAVLNKGISTKDYQQLLLAFSSNGSYSSLANAINYSLIKKRFTVMKTKTSKPVLWLQSLIILPFLAILIYGFSEKVIIEKTQNLEQTNKLEIPEGEGATEGLMKEYNNFRNKFKSNPATSSEISRAIAIYKIMTNTQRNSIKTLSSDFFNLYKNMSIPRHPSQSEFDSWKNSNEFIFFIDGKIIRTEELNNYSPKDIYNYSNRLAIHNNSNKGSYESKKYMLSTRKEYHQNTLNFKSREYHKLLSTYLNEIEKFQGF